MVINNSFLFKLQQKFPFLSKIISFGDGYIADKEREEDYKFGANKIKKQVLVEDGQWSEFAPETEMQCGRYIETMGCTGYGLMNIFEFLSKVLFKEDWNKSDRYTNKMTNTSKRGNSMINVLDITRKKAGVVDEELYSWDRYNFKSWDEYYQEIPKKIKDIGKKWLEKYKVGKYSVDVNALDKIGVPAIEKAISDDNIHIIIIDEIGKMEMLSERFCEVVIEALDSDKPIIVTLHKKSRTPLLQDVRRRDDIRILEVTPVNRNLLPYKIEKIMKEKLPPIY